MVKQVKQQIDKKKKTEKKDRELGNLLDQDKNSNAFKSGKFFKNLTEISKADKDKKQLKRSAKAAGIAQDSTHNHGSAKRFKM